jgi:hypothetical protein
LLVRTFLLPCLLSATLASCSIGESSVGESNARPGTGDEPASVDAMDLNGSPKYYRAVRLTNQQWASSVQDILHLDGPSGLESAFENSVAGAVEFTNNELLLGVNKRAWRDLRVAAEKLAEQVTADEAALAKVYAGDDAAGFIESVGRRAYRRPLTEAEIANYTTLFDAAMPGEKGAFAAGAALVIRALLQSPHFLYRTELEPVGTPLSGYELAAKLSFWLRGTTPSDDLLDAAETLTDADALAAQASAMLEEPSALQVMRDFHRQLLDFDRYATVSKLGVPGYTESLNAEYEQSSYLFFDKIFNEGLGVRDILTSTRGFVGPGLAELYGIRIDGTDFVEQELGPARAGYFSQVPYLALNAINGEGDSIHRGVTINLDVLCATLGPPAPNLPPIPPLQAGQTNRQRITTLTSGCGGSCHNDLINPIGFAFEHFDGMGRYQEKERGTLDIDSSGSYAFSEGVKSFNDNVELMQMMADDRQAHLCYAKKLVSFGLQRDVVRADLPLLMRLSDTSRRQAGSLKQLIVELVQSDAFRTHLGAEE